MKKNVLKTVSFVLAALVAASFASFASFAEGPRADAVFTDVGEADWFFPYVSYAYENGLMTGVSDTLFEPGGDMSRAMIVTVLWRMEGEPSPGGAAPFSDLSADWYRGAVAWAAENGIVNGTGEGRFSPSTPLTREQIAVIMIRYSSYKGFDFPDRADLSAFPDGASVAGYAADAVSRSVAAGLLTGTPRDGLTYLDPRGTATRAQVAAILYRYDLTDKSPASGDRTVLLSADVAPSFVGDAGDLSGGSLALSDFALRLYRGAGTSGKNTLVSPLSVFTALAMTQNGARGETLAEMERTLGLTADDANLFIHTLTDSFGKGDGAQLKTANSVWFTTASRFSVNRAFLKKNADYYGADIFASPFDSGTLDDINGWVEEKTDGMIKKILDVMPPEAVAYMINAICFDAEWASPYHAKDVSEDVFRNSDGTETTVEMMASEERSYLSDDGATGFIKYYSGGKYAFAALLPDEGVSLDDYAASLDGERLSEVLSGAQRVAVDAYMPKFEIEFARELSDVLRGMGMELPFDEDRADLRDLGTSLAGNLYISRVIHKTYISVAERGTRAGAATAIEVIEKNARPGMLRKTVRLDRPFLYMIIDVGTGVPIFLGSVNEL